MANNNEKNEGTKSNVTVTLTPEKPNMLRRAADKVDELKTKKELKKAEKAEKKGIPLWAKIAMAAGAGAAVALGGKSYYDAHFRNEVEAGGDYSDDE